MIYSPEKAALEHIYTTWCFVNHAIKRVLDYLCMQSLARQNTILAELSQTHWLVLMRTFASNTPKESSYKSPDQEIEAARTNRPILGLHMTSFRVIGRHLG